MPVAGAVTAPHAVKLQRSAELGSDLAFAGYAANGAPRFIETSRDRHGRPTLCELSEVQAGALVPLARTTPVGPWDCIDEGFWKRSAGVVLGVVPE